MMTRRRSALVLGPLLCVLLTAPHTATAEGPGADARPSQARRVYDATILRPLAFVNLIGAAIVYPVAYPVTWVTGGTDQVQRWCWDVPAERVFERPLGEL